MTQDTPPPAVALPPPRPHSPAELPPPADGEGDTDPLEQKRHYLVAIGASAGGLEALSALISHLPTDLGIPYIILQHLSPTYRSMLVQLLGRETPMQVCEIEDGMSLLPNQIYITPPNRNLVLQDGLFHLTEPSSEILPKPSVNACFHSLSEERGENVIGVILSGTGTDGASGVRAIKAGGGLVFAQEPGSAKYSGMPQAAIETDCVDWVLPPEEIAREITVIVRTQGSVQPPARSEATPSTLKALLQKVQRYTKVDFSEYKESTVWRRILRRIAANRVDSLAEYISLTERNPEELNQLCKEILISVTSFFRGEDAFQCLSGLLAERLRNKRPGDEIRVWVPGCATGEEAYSIAMLIAEILGEARLEYKIQIFATDIDNSAMNIARKGIYPESSLEGLKPSLVNKYFTPRGDSFEISKMLREMVVIARQNVAQDPPFLRLDLVSCRNLLIYFLNSLQERVLGTFHYSLLPGGLLFLGKSESVYQRENLFEPLDRNYKIFRRRDTTATAPAFPALSHAQIAPRPTKTRQRSIEEQFLEIAASTYVPPSIVISATLDVLHVFGDVSRFLQIPQGRMDFNLLNMVRKEWRTEIQTLIYQAQQKRGTATGRVHLHTDQPTQIAIRPMEREFGEAALFVAFEQIVAPAPASHAPQPESSVSLANSRELEDELVATREHLQTVIEELETSNEETQALNEELQASNEELQASNEELQAANEELQSTNEELTTVNEELQVKSAELAETNADLENVQNSVDFAVLVVSEQLRLARFNESAARLLTLNHASLGESLRDILASRKLTNFADLAEDVVRKGHTIEQQISSSNRHYLLRISPRMTALRAIQGAVISLLDETALFESQRSLRESQRQLMAIMNYSVTLISVKDMSGRYQFVNPRFVEVLGAHARLADADIAGKTDHQLFDSTLADLLRSRDLEVMRANGPLETVDTLPFPDEPRTFLSIRFPLFTEDGVANAICTKLTDITDGPQFPAA